MHAGPRQHRLQWVDNETVITSGFDSEAKRQYGVWDLRNMDQALAMGPLPEGTGVGYIYFDQELKVMTMAGRGDSNIYHFGVDKSTPTVVEQLCEQNNSTSTKAFCFAPKRVVDVAKQEIMRGYRLTSDKKLETLCFRIPSKTGGFNDAYYPPFPSNEPAGEADAWFGGTDVPPNMTQLKMERANNKKVGMGGLAARRSTMAGKRPLMDEETKGGSAQADSSDSAAEIAALKKEIATLKGQLAAAQSGDASASAEDLSTKPELGYWKIRGLAAQIRYMFYYLKVDFTDTMYEVGDAPDFDRSCWFDVKPTLGFEYPNLPYLIDGETKLTETAAIMMYVAKKYDPTLLGKNAAEQGRVQMLLAHVADLKMKATMPCYVSGDQEAAIEDCKPVLDKLVEAIGSSQWIAGDNLTWLDFYFAELLALLDAMSDGLFYAQHP